ncbi:hypothetical protein [Legionella shakespearei]|uniref:Uncharacterized protein n=1 Tax=Legionella shakespearei DSM 23087 TaxID=1122169 RepID=A0A0W0YRW0_9GAMM|nr:hypothetical protein [Legionella shakespearei]KTD59556.1 hypothetical protein Lsha_1828 [Legionella shakespearei DSM 23087]
MIVIRKVKSIIFICITIMFFNCYAGETGIEQITITPKMQDSILLSPFKANLQTNNGHRFIAYLYAPDEKSEETDSFSRVTKQEYHTISKVGHFFIYLYDVETKSFSNYRTKVFKSFSKTRFNDEGAKIMILSGSKVRRADVLLISQFGTGSGDVYEAYGFSKNNTYLKNYNFSEKYKEEQIYYEQFYGSVISKEEKLGRLAYNPSMSEAGEYQQEKYLSISEDLVLVK